jgi:hypothetical protein
MSMQGSRSLLRADQPAAAANSARTSSTDLALLVPAGVSEKRGAGAGIQPLPSRTKPFRYAWIPPRIARRRTYQQPRGAVLAVGVSFEALRTEEHGVAALCAHRLSAAPPIRPMRRWAVRADNLLCSLGKDPRPPEMLGTGVFGRARQAERLGRRRSSVFALINSTRNGDACVQDRDVTGFTA